MAIFDSLLNVYYSNSIPYFSNSAHLLQNLNVPLMSVGVEGTRSHLMEPRKSDDDRGGLKEWSIKSVHTWGEDPTGTWEIAVTAHVSFST